MEIITKQNTITILLTLFTTSICSLIKGGVLISSTNPILDFTVGTNYVTAMYGYSPANLTAKRIDTYNTLTNSLTTLASNIQIVYSPYLTMELSLPVNRIRPTIDKNT